MSTVQAEKLFRDFFDRDAEDGEIVDIATKEPETVLIIGELVGIIYRSETDKLDLIHHFKASDRPLLLVSYDGSQLYAIKGSYRFTDKGFVG